MLAVLVRPIRRVNLIVVLAVRLSRRLSGRFMCQRFCRVSNSCVFPAISQNISTMLSSVGKNQPSLNDIRCCNYSRRDLRRLVCGDGHIVGDDKSVIAFDKTVFISVFTANSPSTAFY